MRYLIALFISFLFVAPVSAQVSCDSATDTSSFILETPWSLVSVI